MVSEFIKKSYWTFLHLLAGASEVIGTYGCPDTLCSVCSGSVCVGKSAQIFAISVHIGHEYSN